MKERARQTCSCCVGDLRYGSPVESHYSPSFPGSQVILCESAKCHSVQVLPSFSLLPRMSEEINVLWNRIMSYELIGDNKNKI